METCRTCKLNKTHLSKKTWLCSFCDKNTNDNFETGQINSNLHKRRERFAFIVKKYKFDNPEITRIYNILKDVIKVCKDKLFHTFEQRWEYANEFEYKTSGEAFHFTIFNNFKLFSSQLGKWPKIVMNRKKMVTNSVK